MKKAKTNRRTCMARYQGQNKKGTPFVMNSIRNARIQFKMPCYRKSHIRLRKVSNSAVRLVRGNKRNKKKTKYVFVLNFERFV